MDLGLMNCPEDQSPMKVVWNSVSRRTKASSNKPRSAGGKLSQLLPSLISDIQRNMMATKDGGRKVQVSQSDTHTQLSLKSNENWVSSTYSNFSGSYPQMTTPLLPNPVQS